MSGCRTRAITLTALTAVAAVTAVAGCGGDATQPDEGAVDVVGDCETDTVEALGAWGEAGFNGVVVVDSPDRRCGVGVGWLDGDQVTSDSVFAIGSVSKAFTAAAVLQLEAAGALELDDPAGAYVEGLTGPAAGATIGSLMFHTSGLVGSHGEDSEPLSKRAAIEAISALTVDEAARGTFLYSNAGYTLLAMVVEGASGLDYRRYMREHVLPDEGRFWRENDGGGHWATEGNGDLAMSPKVLADWTGDLFDGSVVPPGSLDLVLEPTVDDDGQGITAGWARLSEDLFGEPVVATAGGGGDIAHNVVTAWLPESKRTVVVASSTDAITAETLLQAIGSAVVAGDAWPQPDDTADVDAELLQSSVGTYTLTTGGRYDVVAADDRLMVDLVGADALAAIGRHADVTDDEVASHEDRVLRMLAGETQPGRAELALLEEEFGPLGEVRLLGSMVEDGELRTYVELDFAQGGTEAGWYALDSAGGIAAVDLVGPPRVALIPTARGFRVDGQPLGEQAVVVTFDDTTMTIAGPAGTVVAVRS